MPPLENGVRCFEWQRVEALAAGGDERVFAPREETPALLQVEGLEAVHKSHHDRVIAAADVSFSVAAGECLGLVGESGSGKTTIARCVVGLHQPSSGRILLDGEALAARAKDRTREQRRRCQIVFQNPYESLNPLRRVGDQVAHAARVLRGLGAREARAEALRLLELVRLPARTADRFPRELSGGERQRIAIARAAVAQPDLIVCDEITSALDVSVQAAVLQVLGDLRRDFGLGLLFITHNLGVVATVADEVLVLQRGLICEQGPTTDVLEKPQDAYPPRLLAAAPSVVEVMEQWGGPAGGDVASVTPAGHD
jgi:peptide/nickel transport system ATP-binding protein